MLTVVSFEDGKVTLESDYDNGPGRPFSRGIDELSHMNARRMAEKHAAENGLGNAACGIPTSAYPVDADGAEITTPDGKPARYRVDIPLTQRLI